MQGTQSIWYDHYRGVVYPVLLDGPSLLDPKRDTPPSLLESCCDYITRDSTLTSQAIETVPPIMLVHLMEAALKGHHDSSVHVLMQRWGLPSIVLSKLIPTVFSSLRPYYDSRYQIVMIKEGLRYTTCLAHTFLETLRQENTTTKIRRLDLTSFPTAEVILYYLTAHCMLVHNENMRNNMVNLYNQTVSLADECGHTTSNPRHMPIEQDSNHCLPQDISVEIKLDAFVTSESCHSELCKALTVSNFPGARFRIAIDKLSIACLGAQRIALLLKQMAPDQLRGLQLKYNSLRNADFLCIAPMLKTLTNLTALDLSNNNINLTDDDTMAFIVGETLSKLTKLERLDLTNNRLKKKLGSILRSLTTKSLKQLRVLLCGLKNEDFTSLSLSPHLDTMEELEISENSLTLCHLALGKIIDRTRDTLKVLEMENIGLCDEDLINLAPKLTSMSELRLLNLSHNRWAAQTVTYLTGLLKRCTKLRVFQLSYPRDLYQVPEDDEFLMDAEEEKDQIFLAYKTSLESLLNARERHRTMRSIEIVLDEVHPHAR